MEIIKGRVKKGRGLGKVMGFPTLNMGYEGENQGVFAGRVVFHIDGEAANLAGATNDRSAGSGKSYNLPGAIHIGPRPTINDPQPVCEVFILDFPHELNDKSFECLEIEVHLIRKIREIEKFENLDDLTAQIAKDVTQINVILGSF